MAAVTVPGLDGSAINYTGVFATPQNQTLAQGIANALAGYLSSDALNIQLYVPPPGTTSPPVSGDANELLITAASDNGTIFTPAGYSFVADSTGGGALTVVGAQNFIGGNGNLTVWNTVGTNSIGGGIDSITAGNGADLFGLVAGSTYDVAAGNGSDTFYGNGSGTIAGGTGSNLFFTSGGPNLVLSYGHDTIAAGGGAATVATYGAAPLIFGGSGSLEVFGNTATNETVVGGSGPETIFGAQSGVYFLGSSDSLFIDNTSASSTIVGTTGSETVFGGASAHELIFNNSSSLLFASGSGDSTTIVGGSNPSTLFGSAGSAITYFSTSSVGGALYAAGTGNETLNAAGSTSNNVIFGGADSTAGNSLVGGAGNDTYVVGTGSDTMVGGSGSNEFAFDSGHAGGNDFIVGYNANDVVGLFGYGTAAAATALATATVAGGSTSIALSDHTKITFENVSTPSSIHIFST
jgi:Ca2+-binding RTX toxin-like protein